MFILRDFLLDENWSVSRKADFAQLLIIIICSILILLSTPLYDGQHQTCGIGALDPGFPINAVLHHTTC